MVSSRNLDVTHPRTNYLVLIVHLVERNTCEALLQSRMGPCPKFRRPPAFFVVMSLQYKYMLCYICGLSCGRSDILDRTEPPSCLRPGDGIPWSYTENHLASMVSTPHCPHYELCFLLVRERTRLEQSTTYTTVRRYKRGVKSQVCLQLAQLRAIICQSRIFPKGRPSPSFMRCLMNIIYPLLCGLCG